jgi:hypothetical protein
MSSKQTFAKNMNANWQSATTGTPNLAELIRGARDSSPVSGLTHNFYRYPARFSPAFVRAAIKAFSQPGDWILDPFVGGGTSLVEAIAHGRNAIGIDISALATFICEAKTQLVNDDEVAALRRWAARLDEVINIHGPSRESSLYSMAGYFRNLEGQPYWRLKKAIEQLLASVSRLDYGAAQTIARCIVLKTAQWALDSRKSLPTVGRFRKEILVQAEAMIGAAVEFQARTKSSRVGRTPTVVCLNRSAAGMEADPALRRRPRPKLIITSPPYPGIHVLYHRWQVDGRKETPAPFWIANRLDGAGLSYYTMGDRKNPELRTYFENLEATFRSIALVCDDETTVVQMVAFSEPEWQLAKYLEVMSKCGLQEVCPWKRADLGDGADGRLWRDVPNRRWHADQKEHAPGSREVVLIHKKA